ncbi:DUF4190 domain-containing protein [Streptomyces sp. TLI_171]|uniref:DUF4190 domain-containing protein n=1 Tax=Streptomyces sp. TLI_171 TaxID=1938859 RepID=UPI000C17C37D|nr:DUF4190 domain-containing protein [Streptomyces sp. TLI_171]RKE21746.1 uncharacterized protein DUF4190 [Streptomyces sp. TLI_171]
MSFEQERSGEDHPETGAAEPRPSHSLEKRPEPAAAEAVAPAAPAAEPDASTPFARPDATGTPAPAAPQDRPGPSHSLEKRPEPADPEDRPGPSRLPAKGPESAHAEPAGAAPFVRPDATEAPAPPAPSDRPVSQEPANPWAVAAPSPVAAAPGPVPGPNPWAVAGTQQPWGSGALPPPAAGAPGAPGWGAQPGFPAQPGYPGYPAGPQAPRSLYTNGLAIASLVTGLICCVGFIAIGLGIGALKQIKRTGERGKALAVVGIVTGSIWLLVMALFLAFGDFSGDYEYDDGYDSPNSTSTHTSAGGSGSEPLNSPFVLMVGQCFDDSQPLRPKVVDCAVKHDGEVFWTGQAAEAGADYPGDAVLRAEADRQCLDHLDSYVLDTWSLPEEVGYKYFYPERISWKRTTGRRIVCFLANTDKSLLTGSFRTDLSKLTPDQKQLLDAANPYDRALNAAPDEDIEIEDDPAAYRAWARSMATASTELTGRLTSAKWNPAQQGAANDLAAEIKVAGQHFRAAADSKDDATLRRELRTATDHLGMDQITELRRELGLGTLDEEPAKHSSGQTV